MKPARKKGATPSQRCLVELRRRGWAAAVVERRLPTFAGGKMLAFGHVTKDLFGCIDIVAVRGAELVGVLGVQACSAGDVATRLKKAMAQPLLAEWLHAGNRFEVWGWVRPSPGGRRRRWALTVRALHLSDLDLAPELVERFAAERAARIGIRHAAPEVADRVVGDARGGFLNDDDHHHGD